MRGGAKVRTVLSHKSRSQTRISPSTPNSRLLSTGWETMWMGPAASWLISMTRSRRPSLTIGRFQTRMIDSWSQFRNWSNRTLQSGSETACKRSTHFAEAICPFCSKSCRWIRLCLFRHTLTDPLQSICTLRCPKFTRILTPSQKSQLRWVMTS